MKEIKVTIEGKEFVIDIDKAKELGVVKEDTTIKDFRVGDMYGSYSGAVIIVETGWDSCLYNIVGLHDDLTHYSDFGSKGGSRERMLGYLQSHYTKKDFVKNINEDIKKLVKEAISNHINK